MRNYFKFSSLLLLFIILCTVPVTALIIVNDSNRGMQTLYGKEHLYPSSLGSNLGKAFGIFLKQEVDAIELRKKMDQYIEIFLDLGYTLAQAKAYATLSVDNPGGYTAVLLNIERENELKYQAARDQQFVQQQMKAQRQLAELKHQQKLQEIAHKKQSEHDLHVTIVTILSIIFLSIGILFFWVLIYHRLGRK